LNVNIAGAEHFCSLKNLKFKVVINQL